MKNQFNKSKIGIKKKITMAISFSVLAMVVICMSLVYILGVNFLTNAIGREYVQISKLLGDYINESLASEIEDAKVYTTLPLWLDAVKTANLKYSNMDKSQIDLYLADMDKKWISTDRKAPFLMEYLENRGSVAMRDIVKVRITVTELFFTDKYGGVVAASGKTTDFYQADEEWWQEAYDNGKGKVYVGNIELDKSTGSWVITIAVPIMDSKGELIGICKDSISIQRLFARLSLFKIGQTGHALLVDRKGNLIFHHEIIRGDTNLLSADELNKLLARKKAYLTLKLEKVHNERIFIAFSEIKPPYLSEKGIVWVLFIIQNASETFAFLNRFVIGLGVIGIFLVILVFPISSFFGGLMAKPVHELHVATERIMAGNWDYKIEVHTGDEIEQFADTFKTMIADIRNKQKELEDFSRGLEAKVEDRTKDLSKTQEATLNILEDLQDAKEKLERTNKELMKLDQLKSDFISTVSHELRTPLSIIKEGISLVLDKIPGEINEKQHKILDIARYNIDRLARIIDDLLDISKIESGKVELKRSFINIADIVRQTANSFETKIKAKGLELRLDIDSVTGKIYADPDKITQVLTNLIGNAVKFTPSGYIEVACKDRKDEIMCYVSDTGVGIAKNDLSKVFDKFQQFGRIAGAGEKGTGLGLSIAKAIINMHKGTIWVESEAGKGTKFIFRLNKYTQQT